MSGSEAVSIYAVQRWVIKRGPGAYLTGDCLWGKREKAHKFFYLSIARNLARAYGGKVYRLKAVG